MISHNMHFYFSTVSKAIFFRLIDHAESLKLIDWKNLIIRADFPMELLRIVGKYYLNIFYSRFFIDFKSEMKSCYKTIDSYTV